MRSSRSTRGGEALFFVMLKMRQDLCAPMVKSGKISPPRSNFGKFNREGLKFSEMF